MDSILFYGAGHTGQKFRKLHKIQIGGNLAFLDSHKCGTLDGVPVYRVDEAPAELRQYDVLITIHNPDVNLKSIESLICSHGWKPEQIKTLPQFYAEAQVKGIPLPELYWLAQMEWPKYEARIQEAGALFQDEKSLSLWHAILEYRKTGQMPELLYKMDQDQYRPDFLQGMNNISFVDGGAYDGDTIEDFVRHGIIFQKAFCFEPDPKNLDGFDRRMGKLQPNFPITVFPNGLNERFEVLRFLAEGSKGSSVSAEGDLLIQTGRLDRMVCNQAISYIKMDIEGSEIPAIRGSRQIIEKYHPIMAISVYHCPDHLWEIPLLLKSMNPNYHFYLRIYGYNIFDTVCYAVDEQTLAELRK